MTDRSLILLSLFEVGDPVTWRYVCRGGWGYVWHVPAYVVKVGAKRVGIAVLGADGETWKPRWVTPDRLLHGHPSLLGRA